MPNSELLHGVSNCRGEVVSEVGTPKPPSLVTTIEPGTLDPYGRIFWISFQLYSPGSRSSTLVHFVADNPLDVTDGAVDDNLGPDR